MSVKFEVRQINNIRGRGIIAIEDIKSGDIIFEEKPIVSCQFIWNQLYKYDACEMCMRPLETALENARRLTGDDTYQLPYIECCQTIKESHVQCQYCGVKYCSDKCRTDSWEQYHQTLCIDYPPNAERKPLYERISHVWREMHYPPETASVFLLLKMIALIRQSHDKRAAINTFSHFYHSTVNNEEKIAHKLLGEHFKNQINILREYVTNALYDDDISELFTYEGFQSLIALIGTNGQGIGTSVLSCWVQNCDKLQLNDQQKIILDNFIEKLYDDIDKNVGNFLNNEGSGLYKLQSICNHCCEPNVEITFPMSDHTLVMQSIRDIKSGEEITVSYLDECARHRSRHSRIKILRENYLFTCHCVKCERQKDDADVTSDEDDEDEDEDKDNDDDGEICNDGNGMEAMNCDA